MQFPKRATHRGTRGVSPLVGVILLLGITVLLVASFATLAISVGEKVDGPPSFHAGSGTVEFEANTTHIEDQRLVFTHQGGDAVPLDEVEVLLDTGERRVRMPLTEAETVSGTSWKNGEWLTLPVDVGEMCKGTNAIDVTFVQSTGQRTYVIGKETIPVVPSGFAVEDGAVVPNTEYTAEVTIVGTALTYGEDGPDIDITTEIAVGNETHAPWSGDINDENNPRRHTFSELPADAGLAVSATGDPDGQYMTPRTRRSTDTEDGWVYVLRDGEAAPTVQGYGEQNDVSEYLSPYVTENGTVTIADNEAIFLFELGNSQTGDAADYQDLVVLATIEPNASRTSESTQANDATGMVCPSEE